MNKFMILFGQIWIVGSIIYGSNMALKIVMLCLGIIATVCGMYCKED